MRLLFFCIIFGVHCAAFSQSKVLDMKLLKEASLERHAVHGEKKSQFFKGILKLYSNHISDQIINDCIYDVSCSSFSQGAFKEYGLIKGTFLTADRMMRCNMLSRSHVSPVRFDAFGKVTDHWLDYDKEN